MKEITKYRNNRILCIGAGYVGGPTMAVIAEKCSDCIVTVVDINKERIDEWNSDKLPIYEPGLDEIVKKVRGKNLFFSTDVENGILDNDIIFVAVNTPTKTFGKGAGMAANLQYWEIIARQLRDVADKPKIIVEKSTLPVKTAEAMERVLNDKDKFEILSNPEFLAEGTAVNDLHYPDRVLIGSRETKNGLEARKVIVDIYANWVPSEKIITTNTFSSELSKLVANGFLAQRVSSINSISAVCEATEADISEIASAIGSDSRIGSKFLNSSIGFGGSCFKKDILNLVYICKSYGLHEVADYWESVIKINEYQQNRFVANILNSMFNTIAGRKICIFGAAFKANTDDTRESPSINIAKMLIEEKAKLVISDPKALKNIEFDLKHYKSKIDYINDPYEAALESHAIAILTEWDLYKNLDYQKIFETMIKPAFIFDGRNILDHKKLFKIGFNVFPIGKKAMLHYN